MVLASEMPGFSSAIAAQLRARHVRLRSFTGLEAAAAAIGYDPPSVVVLDQRTTDSRVPAMGEALRKRLGADCPRLVLIARHRVTARLRKEFDAVLRPPIRVVEVADTVVQLAARRSSSRSGTRLTVAGVARVHREVVVLSGSDGRRSRED